MVINTLFFRFIDDTGAEMTVPATGEILARSAYLKRIHDGAWEDTEVIIMNSRVMGIPVDLELISRYIVYGRDTDGATFREGLFIGHFGLLGQRGQGGSYNDDELHAGGTFYPDNLPTSPMAADETDETPSSPHTPSRSASRQLSTLPSFAGSLFPRHHGANNPMPLFSPRHSPDID